MSSFPHLSSYFSSLYTNPTIERKIANSILDENTIADDASDTLKQLRNQHRKLENGMKEKINNLIHSSTYSKYLQEPVITIRNDRYVIPVKEEYRTQIKGFIHDISSSGATVFVEPIVIFESNNEINRIKLEEQREIEIILRNLSNMLLPYLQELLLDLELLGMIDFIFAKANYARQINASKPILNEDRFLNLKQARHPLIDPNKVVPIDISLGDDIFCLVITGPNTGGKTVTLKTVGLLCLMAQSGLFLPVQEHSSICIFDTICADIGDEQSIGESLSTFSAHILNISNIIQTSSRKSLILLDELGSGTDPIEGSSLAISILEHFYQQHSLTIATTHYPEIKKYALTHTGFQNASCEFDIENLRPTYHLLMGIPGKSNAFAISQRLGLDSAILARAKQLVTTEENNIEELLKRIYDDKQKIEQEKIQIEENSKKIETLRQSLERDNTQLLQKERELIENAKRQARDIVLSAKEQVAESIKQMQETANTQDIATANNIRNQLNDTIKSLSSTSIPTTLPSSPIALEQITIGKEVSIPSLQKQAIVLSLPNKAGEVQLQIGNTKMYLPVSKLSNVSSSPKKKGITNHSVSHIKTKMISPELNVIGYTLEEALFAVDKYLDDCFVSNLNMVRIVHGKGAGILRKGIHDFLKKHPHVKSYRLGTFGEGEMGVTIVEIK